MARKITTEIFIREAREIHGDRYDYSSVEYVSSKDHVSIVCKVHGVFKQTPGDHLRGKGCKACSMEALAASLRLSQEAFIERATLRWGETLDFSKSVYETNETPIIVTCKLHGDFSIRPRVLFNKDTKKACPKCAKRSRLDKAVKRLMRKFLAAHGDRYDYSKMGFVQRDQKVCIICPTHGEFYQTPHNHENGHGCPACAHEAVGDFHALSESEALSAIKAVWGERFDLSLANYTGYNNKMTVVCPVHGAFETTPHGLLDKRATHVCPECAMESRKVLISESMTKTTEKFIKEAKELHGDTYDYSEVVYVRSNLPVKILCSVHGTFEQAPSTHLLGGGCPRCAREANRIPFETYVALAEAAHGTKLSYKDYQGVASKVTVVCPEHGEFSRHALDHLKSTGCPQCQPHKGTNGSLTELELLDFVQSLDPSARRGDRSIIKPQELDIVSDQTKTAFEFCGLFWHSDYLPDKNLPSLGPKRHLIKLEKAKAAGYRLFTVFEDEWANRQDAVKTLVARALAPEKLPTIGARSCELFTPSWEEAAAFYNQYHLQGATPGTLHLGLRKGDLTLAVMTVGKRSLYGKVEIGDWEMIRFCLNPAYNVPGAMSRLCAWLPAHLTVKRLFSFVDRRWFTGSSYVSAGFTLVKTTEPGYWYVRGLKRESRYKYAKHKLPGLLENFDPALTEVENMRNHGWNRIFDCGQYRFEKRY